MPSHRIRTAVAALVMFLALVPAANAQNAGTYDTPVLSAIDRGLYSVTIRIQAGPSGAPWGFTVEWMKQDDFISAGGWPADAGDARLRHGDFDGLPTLNLWGAKTFHLAPNGVAYVQPGDLFDETGVASDPTSVGALKPGTEYVTRVRALGGIDGDPSGYTPTVSTQTLDGECTQGFWKNFPDRWPPSCLPMLLGTVSYTKAQLLQIFAQPAKGNGLISLAHQLITAKLNLCNGSDPTPIATTIFNADALIGSLVVPPIGSGSLAPSSTSTFTEALDDYNNGRLGGVSQCPTMARGVSTWGQVKVLYR